jgi:DNA-binding CsgD family transcriptional regulator
MRLPAYRHGKDVPGPDSCIAKKNVSGCRLRTQKGDRRAKRLGALIEAALCGTPTAAMSLPHPEDGRLFTVLAASVRSRDLDRFGALGMRSVGAMLMIQDPALPMDIPAPWLMDAYGLTLAEARVVLCAASDATIPETAHRLKVSPNTVKTHLRKVFGKTGASRQAELARLMASIGLMRPDGK